MSGLTGQGGDEDDSDEELDADDTRAELRAANLAAGERVIRVDLRYDGTDFFGWQFQPDRRSVQECLEDAIFTVTGERLRTSSAGRTDAGVHAIQQVASFRTCSRIPIDRFGHALHTNLPDDVTVLGCWEAPADFRAQYSSLQKRYRYVVDTRRWPDPLTRRHAYWYRRPLDLPAMQLAAQVMRGRQSYRSFEGHGPTKRSGVRDVSDLQLIRCDEWLAWNETPIAAAGHPAGRFLYLETQANGFLHHMVRIMMGTLLEVGCGKWTADDVRRILAAEDRNVAGPTAPAQGLYMLRVECAGFAELPAGMGPR